MCIHYFLIKRKKLFGRPNTYGDFDIIDYYNFISRLFIKRIDTFNNRLKLVLRAVRLETFKYLEKYLRRANFQEKILRFYLSDCAMTWKHRVKVALTFLYFHFLLHILVADTWTCSRRQKLVSRPRCRSSNSTEQYLS